MNRFRTFGILLISLLTTPNAMVWAVMHINPEAYPHAKRDMIHHPSAAQIRAAGSAKAATIATSTGTKNVAVIIVQFPASTLISGSNSIQDLTKINGYFTQMASYFNEVSYGQISLNIKFFGQGGFAQATAMAAGAYTLGHPEEYYGCGDEGVGCGGGVTTPTPGSVNANGNYLIHDALVAARGAGPNVDSAHYDEVIVVHAGNGNETTTGSNGDIWSIFYSQDSVIPLAGGGFDEGDVVPETETSGITSPLGVICHEFGHALGLPDLYNTSAIGGSSVVGKWEIMDSGPYDGAGANPAHMSAWDKMTLGWATPTIAVNKSSTTLSFVETSASMLEIPVQNGVPGVCNGHACEYFLVEYRSRSATGALYDHSIPGDGLLIWHIDDAIALSRGINASSPGDQNTVNSGNPHYGVSIVSADGSNVGQTGGTASNPFSNSSTFTSPKSDNFSAQPSGIIMLSISGIGTATASMYVENLQVGASQTITKLINYPNPAGKGYAHPDGEGHTTIQIQLSRPPSDLQINIYTLSGDLVRKVGISDILHNDKGYDANFKIVYEYVWDLKNGDGKMVAPGVYLYLVRADGMSKSNKAVIIR